MKYLFGPVNSRRLGISLGIDLVPFKTCPLDCVYCECGRTTCLTVDPGEYVPTAGVIEEIDTYLSTGPVLDYVTFSGSGEPTLHSGIGLIIDHLKNIYKYKVAVLTNGVLFSDPEVRRRLLRADTVIPSIDAAGEDAFQKILRPASGLTPDGLINSIVLFRNEFNGKLLIEIFIVPGINDTPEELALLKQACEKIRPDGIQINSLDRPGADDWVKPASREKLEEIKKYFYPLAVEVVAKAASRPDKSTVRADMDSSILSTLERRPSTIEDIVTALGIERDELLRRMDNLLAEKKITKESGPRGIYYRPVK